MKSQSVKDVPLAYSWTRMFLIGVIPCLMISCSASASSVPINMHVLAGIESSGNPKAVSPAGARGLYQIMPIVLEEWNNFHLARQYTLDNLFDPEINEKIAVFYLKRIESMLRYYGKEITIENILIAWNFGIGNLVSGKPLPKETINFIEKYKEKTSWEN